MVQAKSFSNTDIEYVAELLEILDFIDSKLEDFKKTYLKFKEKVIRRMERKKQKIDEQ